MHRKWHDDLADAERRIIVDSIGITLASSSVHASLSLKHPVML